MDVQCRDFTLLGRVTKIFGPEHATLVVLKASERLGSGTPGHAHARRATAALLREIQMVRDSLGLLPGFVGLGCIGIAMGLVLDDLDSVRWVQPPLFSPAEAQILRSAFPGDVVRDLPVEDLFSPTSVVLDPLAIDSEYIYVQKGVERLLTFFHNLSFPLYCVVSSTKFWYPYELLATTEIMPLPREFVDFRKLITGMGYIEPARGHSLGARMS